MRLPDNSIGISDLIAYRECARRMSYSMRRHVAPGVQSDEEKPEEGAASHAAAYGSCIHEAIALSEDGYGDREAISGAWKHHGRLLYPEDLGLLAADLTTYHERDFPGTRTVMVEDEIRLPLFEHDGEQIYFRAKIDRLYQVLAEPSSFIHVDYKSSKWPRTQKEVDEDLQMWAYNWAIHEVYPECENLQQSYDQLRYGQVPTSKNASQRKLMREWLIEQTKTLLADEDYQKDGLLAPTFNQWCPWCPVINDCEVIPKLADYSRTRIAALQPTRPRLKKDGTPGKRVEVLPLDSARVTEYAAELEKVKTARATLERFDENVRQLLRELPAEERESVGFTLRSRTNSVFRARAKQEIYDALGERFFRVASVTQEALKAELADDEQLLDFLLGMADKVSGTPAVVRKAKEQT